MTNTTDYEGFRRTVQVGLDRGWIKFPNGRRVIPPMPITREESDPQNFFCKNCGNTFFGTVKKCPACLSPFIIVR